MKKLITLLALSLLAGCAVYELPTGPDSGGDGTVVVIEEPAAPQVNAYIYLPHALEDLIRYRVDGYFLPKNYRYRDELYHYGNFGSNGRNSQNQPSYVIADFNGDFSDDYAMLFSRETFRDGSWFVTTKLLVALADRQGGYNLSMELVLGTVTGSLATESEEYWAIGLMKAGTHSVAYEYNNATVTEKVTLDEDAIFLTSLDPSERSIFYVIGRETYEMSWDRGSLSKGKVNDTRASRIIPIPAKPKR